MLRYYLLSKLSVIKGLTLTFFVMVFFIPQDVFAAAPGKDTAKYISFSAVLIALVIAMVVHVLSVRRSKGNIEVVRQIFSTAPQNVDANVIITDAAWKIIYINPRAEQFLGLEKREALGIVLSDFFDKESLSSLYRLTDKHDVKSKNFISSKIKTKAGVWLDIASIAIPVKNPYSEEMGAVIILQPLEAAAESAAAEELNNFITAPAEENIDALTQLPNRKLLFEHLNSIIRDNAAE
ncbi:MAG: fold, partial [Clostridia bacterium]|nr:fold [Clostridia bacterium]